MDMFDSITAHTLYSDLMMERPLDTRPFLIVEGPEDQRTLDPHVSDGLCLIVVAHGRENVLGAMELVMENDLKNVIALVDADHTRKRDERTTLPNVVSTDLNDLDSEVLHIPGLVDRVGFSHANGPRLRAFLREHNHTGVISALHSIVRPITTLRYMCECNGIAVSLKKFPIRATYAKGTLTLHLDQVKAIVQKNLNGGERSELDSKFEAWISLKEIEGLGITKCHNGHHLFAALHTFLGFEGGYKSKVVNLEDSVRAAVSWHELSLIACIQRLSKSFEEIGFWIWRYEQNVSPSVA